MLPKVGPVLYIVPGSSNVSIGAGTTLLLPFKWPSARFVTGLLVLPLSGVPADAARLEVAITDETQQQIIADGFGGTFAAPGLAMSGLVAWNPLPLQRPVAAGDPWGISVANVGAAPITLAALVLYFEEATL